jgi:hypothetical protein
MSARFSHDGRENTHGATGKERHSDDSSKRQEKNGRQALCGALFSARVDPIRLDSYALATMRFVQSVGATDAR